MIELSIAAVVIAVLARDGFRAWLKLKQRETASFERIAAVETKFSELQGQIDELRGAHARLREVEIKALAEDFKRSLKQVEANADAARKHVDSTVAGTLAQMPNTGRGFGR